MKLNLDQIVAATHIPWDLQIVLTGGKECTTREPTSAEIERMTAAETIKGEEAVQLLSGILQVNVEDLHRCSGGELRAVYASFTRYYFERSNKMNIETVEAAVRAVQDGMSFKTMGQ